VKEGLSVLIRLNSGEDRDEQIEGVLILTHLRTPRVSSNDSLGSEPDRGCAGDGSRRNGAIRGFLLVSLIGAEPARQGERGGGRGSGEREVESRVEGFCEWQG
jgi:hypothetical protein